MTGSRKSTVTSKSVILFHGDKGGVGKSWTCSIFLDWLVKCKLPVTLVDGDTRNPDVSRMFSDLMPTLNANLRIHDGWMDLPDLMMKYPDKRLSSPCQRVLVLNCVKNLASSSKLFTGWNARCLCFGLLTASPIA